jgi:hypothetical protein
MQFNLNLETTLPKGTRLEASVWVDRDSQYGGGYELWDVPTSGNYIYVEGHLELYWDDNGEVSLTGYDGCFELPEFITDALEQKGVIIDL